MELYFINLKAHAAAPSVQAIKKLYDQAFPTTRSNISFSMSILTGNTKAIFR